MSKYILGISAFYHDSAAAILKDGEIIAAAQEERFTRKKHDFSFPANAIDFCLKEAGITPKELYLVGFYDKPFIKFERIITTYLSYAPVGINSFVKSMPLWLKQKLFMKDYILGELKCDCDILFTEHHESHAASAFYPSPYEKAAILTLDGVGEWATASYGIGEGNKIGLKAEIRFPHSLGLLYSAFTYYAGFRVNSGEYKLMGLAPYGESKFADIIRRELIDIKPDGSFKLNMKYFNYCAGLTMVNDKFCKLFGAPPRKPESEITQHYMDIAKSIQDVTEEVMLKMADHLYAETKLENLCLAGGVALNCVGNGKILSNSKFKNIWIQPAAGDAGGALGVALFVWYRYLNNERKADNLRDFQKGSYLGPQYDDDYMTDFVKKNEVVYDKVSEEALPGRIAQLIKDQKVVGLVEGKMEFGPRALGARSIIGDARSREMQEVINLKTKFRESFRPFAPTVLSDKSGDYFEINQESPYMLLVAPVKENKILPESRNTDKRGIEKLKIKRSAIPAVTHIDYSARVQTVNKETNPLYYRIIEEFEKLTGCPVIINTSFNIRGEPIVCTPEDAYRCFMCTNMDFLVIGNYIFDKEKQPNKDKYHKDDISTVLD
ncbi:MAG: carbamoyltransferase [Candidatus Omnitrophica bacterium]|nr:carbamoyltransferase [Candidatus Omnitrophota bacterium]